MNCLKHNDKSLVTLRAIKLLFDAHASKQVEIEYKNFPNASEATGKS